MYGGKMGGGAVAGGGALASTGASNVGILVGAGAAFLIAGVCMLRTSTVLRSRGR